MHFMQNCTLLSFEASQSTVDQFIKHSSLAHLWPDLPKGVLYTHSFESHFSWSFDRYNRPTVHACTIVKASTVCFYWGLIHGPVWCPRVLGWSVNGSNLPSQADSWQGITTGLASKTGHWCSYIWDVWSWKQHELKPFGHNKVFVA